MCVCFLSIIKLVLVLRVPYGQGTRVYVPLTCGEAYQDQSVFWKKNGNTTLTTTIDTISTTTNTCANVLGAIQYDTILHNANKKRLHFLQKSEFFFSQMAN